MGHYIFTDSSSARQLVTKRGVGKSETFRWNVAMDSEKKGLQVPTGSNMASLNAKLLGAQRPRYLMNLIGCWHSEDQVRVGEYERRGVGSVGGLAANGYRSIPARRRQHPV